MDVMARDDGFAVMRSSQDEALFLWQEGISAVWLLFGGTSVGKGGDLRGFVLCTSERYGIVTGTVPYHTQCNTRKRYKL